MHHDWHNPGSGAGLLKSPSACPFAGGRILLKNANLHLVRGRRYGLCGANGVGKVLHVPLTSCSDGQNTRSPCSLPLQSTQSNLRGPHQAPLVRKACGTPAASY